MVLKLSTILKLKSILSAYTLAIYDTNSDTPIFQMLNTESITLYTCR